MRKKFHRRQSLRCAQHDYNMAGYYFVTVCVRGHICVLGEVNDGVMKLNDAGRLVEKVWASMPQRFCNIKLDAMVIMPDHIHGIIKITDDDGSAPVGAIYESPLQMITQERHFMILPLVMGYFKMSTAKQINILHGVPRLTLWQRGFYDHIIRDEKDLYATRHYIQTNPARWSGNL